MLRLTARENPLVKEAIKLKQKKYRQLTGTFLIEGERMLRELLKTPELIVRVFLDENYPVPLEFDHLPIDTYRVTSSILKAMADTEHPQGVVAVARIPQYQGEILSKPSSLLLLLDRISDPGNLGTIIRTAWAMDVDGILLTPGSADPFSPKVVRSTMGGVLHVPIFNADHHLINQLLSRGYRMIAATPKAHTSIYEADWQGAVICAIGSEAHGLDEMWLNQSVQQVVIPINPTVDSLNAAVSCAIIMAEARRQRAVSN